MTVQTNPLLRPVLNRYSDLYYGSIPYRSSGSGPTSIVDAYNGLKHAWDYGPTIPHEVTRGRIVYSRFSSKSVHTSFVVDGERVKADFETFVIEGDEEQMLPLVQFACQFPCDGKNVPYVQGLAYKSYLPALLLKNLEMLGADPILMAMLKDYGIGDDLIEHLKSKREQGSWLNIVAAVELWLEDQATLRDALWII